jgi:nanoRNase/pAp phosphatase (c-di-AMP/oligoRNAs hydrolase)
MATPPDFTAGAVLTAAQMDLIGLWLVKSETISGSSVDITDCFSSDYDSYKVVVSNLNKTSSTVRALNLQMLDNTTPDTSANYGYMYNFAYGSNLGGNASAQFANFYELGLMSNREGQHLEIEFNSPFLEQPSSIGFKTVTYQSDVNSYIVRHGGGGHNVAASYNGFSLQTTTDSLSGTVRVYGYRN